MDLVIMKHQHQYSETYDRWILFTTLALIAFGLLMVASSSIVISDKHFGYPFHYLLRQLIFALIGIGLAWGVTRIPLQIWLRYSGYLILFLGLSLLLLIAVLIPGCG